MPDEVQLALVVVEAEQEGADTLAVLVQPVAADHAVHGAAVLDLDHLPAAFGVGSVERLRHDAVEAGRFELVEPAAGDGYVGGAGGEEPWRAGARAEVGRRVAADFELDRQVPRAGGAARRRAGGEGRRRGAASRSNSASCAGVSRARSRTRLSAGWMRFCRASKSSLPSTDHHHLAVEHRARWQPGQRRLKLGEVAEEGLGVAAVEAKEPRRPSRLLGGARLRRRHSRSPLENRPTWARRPIPEAEVARRLPPPPWV